MTAMPYGQYEIPHRFVRNAKRDRKFKKSRASLILHTAKKKWGQVFILDNSPQPIELQSFLTQ
ncbi:MAG: hypothetical protein JSV14_10830, partial [Deltaproteobacteria bacterium]